MSQTLPTLAGESRTAALPTATARSESPRARASQAWLRALELTTPIPRQPQRTLPVVVEEQLERFGDRPALLSDGECWTYRELGHRVRQYARWACDYGIRPGEVVGLLMPNRPEYLAIWLGITRAGGIVALLNTNLRGRSLAHCIAAAGVKCLIVAEDLAPAVAAALTEFETPPPLLVHAGATGWSATVAEYSAEPLMPDELPPVTISDRALYIYTSGSTGLPKAVNVSHARVLQWGHWFAGMMQAQPTDRLYNCLPMYHSVGGVLAPGAMLAVGGATVLRERFSASQFWSDIQRWDCTAFQYIGELCRYLLHQPPVAEETTHRLRLACGNGLAAGVWEAFQQRFAIPQILEFYAATEGGLSLFNVPGRPGAIGQIPGYLVHRFAPALVLTDPETGAPQRDSDGRCLAAAVDQPGEAMVKVQDDPATIGSRFEGYTNPTDSERKLLRDVFQPGDAWVRTGDLLRRDAEGYYYFVDRLGDTFRWKGENVATSEVAAVLSDFPGILHASVFGVAIPGADGRAGMAAVVCQKPLDLHALHTHLTLRLPNYARPLFLRICPEADLTGTLKYSKTDLVKQGFDPHQSPDPLYFNHPVQREFVPLDLPTYSQVVTGAIRL